MAQFEQYLNDNSERFEQELCELLRIPSVSTDPAFAGDVAKAADWVASQFKSMDLHAEVIETIGHPLVYAESPAVPGAPTVLVYGHYDVQPPDPLDEWISPPFEPTVRDGNLYARGATDDKGQMFTHVKGVQSLMKTEGKLPLQVKFLIEGEEECGSKGLYDYIAGPNADPAEIKEKLGADVCVISDSSQFGPGMPAITYGLKGLAYFQIHLQGPKQDLHSGSFGGAVTNPVNTLAKMLAALTDDNGKVQIPGFYDGIIELTEEERAKYAELPFTDEEFMASIGVEGLTGEAGYTTLERRWARPTCDVNGIWGGYQGEGEKTVLPAKAGAKFSFRLVPNQDPVKIGKSLEQFFRSICPPGIKMELQQKHQATGVLVPLDNPFMAGAAKAIESGFGKQPYYMRQGGSIPIVSMFKERLGMDSLLLGWGLDDDNTHSPNEKFNLADFHRGIKASAHLWHELATVGKQAASTV